ncbi:methyltransferase domain-containing protein [Dermatophilaceae bacterium Sec6.4]
MLPAGGDTVVVDGDALTVEVRSAYDALAQEYASRFAGTEPEQAVDLAMIDHFISLLVGDGPEVLDAGCGNGRISQYLADRGCVVRGVDLSPGMIAMAHRDHPDIATQVASIIHLPSPDDRLDGVVYWYSIIHVADSDLPAVFEEARRVLRPSGVMLVAFQAGEGVSDVGAGFRKLGYDGSLTRFNRTAEQVWGQLTLAGFCEEARLVRRPITEKNDQTFQIVRTSPPRQDIR